MEAVASPAIYSVSDLFSFLVGVPLASAGWPALALASYLGIPSY
ncbi:hypothetical protein [Paracoccus aminophilus]|nr:hypothetical protein [Paracoccus aminophilus]